MFHFFPVPLLLVIGKGISVTPEDMISSGHCGKIHFGTYMRDGSLKAMDIIPSVFKDVLVHAGGHRAYDRSRACIGIRGDSGSSIVIRFIWISICDGYDVVL